MKIDDDGSKFKCFTAGEGTQQIKGGQNGDVNNLTKKIQNRYNMTMAWWDSDKELVDSNSIVADKTNCVESLKRLC